MSDPSCRTFRELLGVYVIGAIEPVERSGVDSHLSHCYDCREELAGLAVLPALLHRVPVADAEKLTEIGAQGDDLDPSPEMLTSLLRQVGARRRKRRLRMVYSLAAAIIIAVGGGAAISRTVLPTAHHPVASHQRMDVARASHGVLAATVRYDQSTWGTAMWVQVSGFPQWTTCKFWVTTKGGRRELAGGWIIGPGGDQMWYPVYTTVRKADLAGFVISSGRRVLLRIPAS